MSNKDLFKQAIAEAKSVREAAIANAKEALEETLTPHIKDLLAARLQEMEDKEDMEEEVVSEGDGFNPVKEAEEEDEDEMATDDSEESEEEAEEEDLETGEESEEVEGEEELGDLTVDQFKGMIRDIIAQEIGGGDSEGELGTDLDAGDPEGMGDEETPIEEPMGEPDGMEGGDDEEITVAEEEINIDEILAELENEEISGSRNEKTVKEDFDSISISTVAAGVAALGGVSGGIAALQAWLEKNNPKVAKMLAQAGSAAAGGVKGGTLPVNKGSESVIPRQSRELAESLKTINALKKDLQEVNILNSKLLYVNKIFKANTLTESQKVNIISAFDKAETVKEVKLVYETVSESIVKAPKKNVTESRFKGSASRAGGIAPKKPEVITEVNEAVRRMQVLAGIIKD